MQKPSRYPKIQQPVMTIAAIAIAFWGVSVSPLGSWLESIMVAHMLVQLPMLVLLGVWLGHGLPNSYWHWLEAVNRGGIFGCITFSFVFLFWMLPRWLDASLVSEAVAWGKYISLFIGGVLLRLSWPRAHFITRGVIQLEFLAMLYRLGWLYLISPNRLCNSYLLADQVWLGRGFLAIGLALSISWLIPLFLGGPASNRSAGRSIEVKNQQHTQTHKFSTLTG